MKLLKRIALVAAGAALALGLLNAGRADATPPPLPTCPLTNGWYVNPDESNRKPAETDAGLLFSGSDLIHHAMPAPTKLADLKPGGFMATPYPDQPSFFSVEVRDASTGGYGTLRWNTSTKVWDLTTNLDQFHKADPADFIGTQTKFGKLTEKTMVISFGVGYTANPPGTVDTTVSSVTFSGQTWTLKCVPAKASASPSPSKTSASPKPSPSKSSAVAVVPPSGVPGAPRAVNASASLPVTGPPVGVLIAGGALLFVVGVTAVWGFRKRTRFQA